MFTFIELTTAKKILVLLFAYSVFAPASAAETKVKEAVSYRQLIPYYYAAARTGDEVVIREFLKAGFPVNLKNDKGYTALMIATYHGRANTVKALITLGADVCARDNKGNSALMAAIFKGEITIAKWLLESECDQNRQNNAGQSAVMFSTVFGRSQLTRLLIERGADLSQQDNKGNSALSLAAQE